MSDNKGVQFIYCYASSFIQKDGSPGGQKNQKINKYIYVLVRIMA